MAFFTKAPQDLLREPPPLADWDPRLVKALAAYQERLHSTDLTEDSLHSVDHAVFFGNRAADGTVMAEGASAVVTGQQPGIFLGPLYTVYKAATAVLLASKIGQRHRVPCTPVFWLGSDDHDFEETRVAHFLTKSHELLSLRYEPQQDVAGLPMHRVPLEPSLHKLIDHAAAESPGSEFRQEVSAFLHDTLDASDSLADWAARILARLFDETSLVVFSPHLLEARAAATPVLAREIEEPLASTRLLNEAGMRLSAVGFPVQVVKADNECCFFFAVEGRRRKVLFEGGAYVLPEIDRKISTEDMRALLEENPDRFSPNVALRPVIQQHLFHAAAYVAGPAEIAYWAQLKDLFAHFEEPMPVVYPRAHCVLTSLKLNKLIEKTGLTLADLDASPEELLERALQTAVEHPAHKVLAEGRKPVLAAFEELRAGLADHDATAADMTGRLVDRVTAEFDRIDRVLARGDESRLRTLENQIARLVTALAPGRKPQERVYTVCSFLFEHGFGLISRLLRELDVESFKLNEVEL